MRNTTITETADAGTEFAHISMNAPVILPNHMDRIGFVRERAANPGVLAFALMLLQILVGDLCRTAFLIGFGRGFFLLLKVSLVVVLAMDEKRGAVLFKEQIAGNCLFCHGAPARGTGHPFDDALLHAVS